MTIGTKDNFDKVIANGKVLAKFGAEWCGYCRMMEPVLKELANKYDGVVSVVKVDVDEETELADRYDATTLPTFIVFENGVETKRKIGAMPIEELERLIG